MKKSFSEYRAMFITLAYVMDVSLNSPLNQDFISFVSNGIDFKVIEPNQNSMTFYQSIIQNSEKMRALGLNEAHEFFRFQTKQLWYRDTDSYNAKQIFGDDFDYWFANYLNNLFDDKAFKSDFNKSTFLKTMFADLKHKIALTMANAA